MIWPTSEFSDDMLEAGKDIVKSNQGFIQDFFFWGGGGGGGGEEFRKEPPPTHTFV